jgi:hypothetical protein
MGGWYGRPGWWYGRPGWGYYRPIYFYWSQKISMLPSVLQMIKFFYLIFLCHPVFVCEVYKCVRIIYTYNSQHLFHIYPLYYINGRNYKLLQIFLCMMSKNK